MKKKALGDQEEMKVLYQEIDKQLEDRLNKFKVQNAERWKVSFFIRKNY